MHSIFSKYVASVSELKKNPMVTIAQSQGEAVAILNRNQPVFYCVPASTYELMLEKLEDLELSEIVKEREGKEELKVSLNDL